MKNITRTITTKVITASAVSFVEGKPVIRDLKPLETMEEMTERKIILYFKEQCEKGETPAVNNIVSKEETYSISLEDFLKHAKKVEPKEKAAEQQEQKRNEEVK